jgi:hypothetical protein
MATTRSFRKPRTLSFHPLEERTMMAGDVAVSVVNGDLKITGDPGANDIAVVQTMFQGTKVTGSYYVTGRNGTTINGTAGGKNFPGVTRDFNINMGGNDDKVTLGSETDLYGPLNKLNVPRDLIVNAGGGYNSVLLGGIDVARNATITSGNARDIIGVHAKVQNDLTISTGGGADEVDVWNSFVGHNLAVDTGLNNTSDVVVMLTTMNIGNDVTITTGQGQDQVYCTEVGANHNLTVKTGGKSDTFKMLDCEVTNKLFADLGSGDDSLTLTNVHGRDAELDGGLGFLDSLHETNSSFSGSRLSRNFENRK